MKKKIISIRLDPEDIEKLEEIKKYYEKQYLKETTGDIVRLAIHCLWVDIRDITS